MLLGFYVSSPIYVIRRENCCIRQFQRYKIFNYTSVQMAYTVL